MEIGVEEIDLQHRFFVELVRRVEKALQSDQARLASIPLFEELYRYADFHFLSESNIFTEIGIDRASIAEHQKSHQDLLNGLRSSLTRCVVGKAEPEEVLNFTREWFLEHSQVTDREMVAALEPAEE
ncbi:MAG: bacteriohemerythrin [Magnetospiraceae bacterium]